MKTETVVILLAAVLSIPLFLVVHYFYGWVCVSHVRRYCAKNKITISGWRVAPAFDEKGIKTENSQVEVLSDDQNTKKIFRFVVWPFGIRDVMEFKEPENEN